MRGDELGDDFGVGVAVEDDALGLQLPLEGGVVLDDAVMDDGDGAVAAEVRMGVAVVGRAVRGPARVADADAARGGLRRAGSSARSAMRPARLAQVQRVARSGWPGRRCRSRGIPGAQPFDEDRFRFRLPV